MRVAVVLLLVLGLCACKKAADGEGVHSTLPLYPWSAPAFPALRPGLWSRDHEGCDYDESKSSGTWPDCAGWMVVRPRNLIVRSEYGSSGRLENQRYALVSGSPQILQLIDQPASKPVRYDYEGLRSLALDRQGRTIRARMWTAYCAAAFVSAESAAVEAESAAPTSDNPSSDVAISPISDTERISDPCLVSARGDVRAAVIASEDPKDEGGIYHWVRDQEH